MAYSSKFSYWYVKYLIKNPFFYLLFIASGVFVFLFLTINTNVKVNKTLNGDMVYREEKFVVQLSEELMTDEIEYIYIYINKSKDVYKVSDFEYEDSQIFINSKENNDIFNLLNGDETVQVKLDIPIEEITLFHKVFVKGGKS